MEFIEAFSVFYFEGQAASLLSNGQSRFFWIYIVSGLTLACILPAFSGAGQGLNGNLFQKHVWVGPSARMDYMIFMINPLLKILIFSWVFAQIDILGQTVMAFFSGLGLFEQVAQGAQVYFFATLLTISIFVADDLCRYVTHYLQHNVPFLWELHKMHHSAEHLNFVTADRHHPLDAAVYFIPAGFILAAVNGVFIGLFGDNLTVYSIAGANILLVLFNLFGGALRHSPIWLSFGKKLENWFISPAMHHIHHSTSPEHFNKNLGGALAIWDRLFGTHCAAAGMVPVRKFGIGEEGKSFHTITGGILLPIRAAISRLS